MDTRIQDVRLTQRILRNIGAPLKPTFGVIMLSANKSTVTAQNLLVHLSQKVRQLIPLFHSPGLRALDQQDVSRLLNALPNTENQEVLSGVPWEMEDLASVAKTLITIMVK